MSKLSFWTEMLQDFFFWLEVAFLCALYNLLILGITLANLFKNPKDDCKQYVAGTLLLS